MIAGKGGVGKTTIAVNLALGWALEGWRVGILDANIHSPSVPSLLGISAQGMKGMEGIEPVTVKGLKVISVGLFLHRPHTPVSWRGPIKHGVLKQFLYETNWGELDYLVIDLPAGVGDEVMSLTQLLKGSAAALIVTTPTSLSLTETKRLKAFFHHGHAKTIGVVLNMARGERNVSLPFEPLGVIPFDPLFMECEEKGTPLISSFPQVEAAHCLRNLAQRCQDALKELRGPQFTITATLFYKRRKS